jgi:hypothetical protein
VRSHAVVEDEVIDKPMSKEPKVIYHIKVLSDELILDRSVAAFHTAVNLRTTRIAEPMFDLHGSELCIELTEELRTVIALNRSDRNGRDQNKTRFWGRWFSKCITYLCPAHSVGSRGKLSVVHLVLISQIQLKSFARQSTPSVSKKVA